MQKYTENTTIKYYHFLVDLKYECDYNYPTSLDYVCKKHKVARQALVVLKQLNWLDKINEGYYIFKIHPFTITHVLIFYHQYKRFERYRKKIYRKNLKIRGNIAKEDEFIQITIVSQEI